MERPTFISAIGLWLPCDKSLKILALICHLALVCILNLLKKVLVHCLKISEQWICRWPDFLDIMEKIRNEYMQSLLSISSNDDKYVEVMNNIMDASDQVFSASKEEKCMVDRVEVEDRARCSIGTNGSENICAYSKGGYLSPNDVNKKLNDNTQ